MTDGPSVSLYGHWICPFSTRVEFALHQREIAHEVVDLPPSAVRGPDFKMPTEFVEHSPLLEIPMVRIDHSYRADSIPILEWLETEIPGRPLLPAEPHAATVVRDRMAEIDRRVFQPMVGIYYGTEPAKVAAASSRLAESIDQVAAWTEPTGWLAGPEPTLAEAVLIPLYVRLEGLRRLGFAHELSPAGLAHAERCRELAGWSPVEWSHDQTDEFVGRFEGPPPQARAEESRCRLMELVFVMDPLETLDPATDTTLALIEAAYRRGHRTLHCRAFDLEWSDGTVWADAAPIEPGDLGSGAASRAAEQIRLTDIDAVLIRPDPPFDRSYLHMTLLLDLIADHTLVINHPRGLRDANEKLYALRFPGITPPTIVTADRERIAAFAADHGGAVVKPIDGHGGCGVMVVRPGDANSGSIVDTVTARGTTPVVVQKYLAEISSGDKRVLLLDGEPLGAILRIPAEDDFRANLCAGGDARAVELDERDHRIIETLAPSLRHDGLAFVGIDIVGGLLTEVNVTSPTGIRQLAELGGGRPQDEVIEWIETAAARPHS